MEQKYQEARQGDGDQELGAGDEVAKGSPWGNPRFGRLPRYTALGEQHGYNSLHGGAGQVGERSGMQAGVRTRSPSILPMMQRDQWKKARRVSGRPEVVERLGRWGWRKLKGVY